jgi:hypothetical protein
MKPLEPNISIEMISSFMEDMTPAQLEKLCNYAAKLFKDKRHKNIKQGTNVRNNNNSRPEQN